jgi:cytidylate kinase
MVITLDGPAGAGKSTVARRVAERLRLRFLDTGAMYRAVTWKALRLGLSDPARIAEMIRSTRLEVGDRVLVDGQDVTAEIRTPQLTRAVKPVADSPECRAELVRLQREIGRDGVVTEGRDQGSVVFPDADFKFYLDASVEERARRRHREAGGDLDEIRRDIERRDRDDMRRPVGALVRPPGAIVIDTTGRTIDQVVEAVCARITSGP